MYYTSKAKGISFALLSAIGFSIMPIFAVEAYKADVTVHTLLVLRFGITAIVLGLYSVYSQRKINYSKKNIAQFATLGLILYTAQAILHFSSVKYIAPSVAILLLFTFPIFVYLITVILKREKILLSNLLAIAVAILGLMLVIDMNNANLNSKGVFLSLAAAIVYALYTVLSSYVVRNNDPWITLFLVSVFATLGILLVGIFEGNLNFNIKPQAILPITGIILISTIIADYAFFSALKYIGSTQVSVICMMEPLFTAFFSFIIFFEVLNTQQYIGVIIVPLACIWIITRK